MHISCEKDSQFPAEKCRTFLQNNVTFLLGAMPVFWGAHGGNPQEIAGGFPLEQETIFGSIFNLARKVYLLLSLIEVVLDMTSRKSALQNKGKMAIFRVISKIFRRTLAGPSQRGSTPLVSGTSSKPPPPRGIGDPIGDLIGDPIRTRSPPWGRVRIGLGFL